MVAGVIERSGILADPTATRRIWTTPRASPDVLDRVERLAAACSRHGVPLRAAAVQVPSRPTAASRASSPGPETGRASWTTTPVAMRHAIQPELWDELRTEGLIPADIPTR